MSAQRAWVACPLQLYPVGPFLFSVYSFPWQLLHIAGIWHLQHLGVTTQASLPQLQQWPLGFRPSLCVCELSFISCKYFLLQVALVVVSLYSNRKVRQQPVLVQINPVSGSFVWLVEVLGITSFLVLFLVKHYILFFFFTPFTLFSLYSCIRVLLIPCHRISVRMLVLYGKAQSVLEIVGKEISPLPFNLAPGI